MVSFLTKDKWRNLQPNLRNKDGEYWHVREGEDQIVITKGELFMQDDHPLKQ